MLEATTAQLPSRESESPVSQFYVKLRYKAFASTEYSTLHQQFIAFSCLRTCIETTLILYSLHSFPMSGRQSLDRRLPTLYLTCFQ